MEFEKKLWRNSWNQKGKKRGNYSKLTGSERKYTSFRSEVTCQVYQCYDFLCHRFEPTNVSELDIQNSQPPYLKLKTTDIHHLTLLNFHSSHPPEGTNFCLLLRLFHKNEKQNDTDDVYTHCDIWGVPLWINWLLCESLLKFFFLFQWCWMRFWIELW